MQNSLFGVNPVIVIIIIRVQYVVVLNRQIPITERVRNDVWIMQNLIMNRYM